MIEHNLDVISAADWLIDLGPEGGDGGGEIVATGTPDEVIANARSHTGRELHAYRTTLAGRVPRVNELQQPLRWGLTPTRKNGDRSTKPGSDLGSNLNPSLMRANTT